MRRIAFWLVILLCGAALVASASLLVDYIRPAPVFCSADGGCAQVRKTIFAYPLGIPTPAIGIGGILAIAMASLVPGRGARIAQAALGVFGGLVGAFLGIVQIKLHTLCPFCAVVDVTSILIAGLSVLRYVRAWDPPESRPLVGLAAVASLAAAVVPAAVGFNKRVIVAPADAEVPLPDVIVKEIQATPRGQVTIVDFVDYECPWCRKANAELEPVLAAHPGKYRLVRKNVPLRMHPHANDAALAACCAAQMGKLEEVASSLITVPPEELTPEGCEKIAASKGLAADAFRACVADPATQAKVKADTDMFKASAGHGLPLMYIDTQRMDGAMETADYAAAFQQAAAAL